MLRTQDVEIKLNTEASLQLIREEAKLLSWQQGKII